MNRLGAALLVGALSTLVATPACSQQPATGRGIDLMRLAAREDSVQAELKLTDEQVKTLAETRDAQRKLLDSLENEDERRAKMLEHNAANDKLLAATLTDEQMTRLKQIAIQASGPRATETPEVAAALNLTDEQKEKIAEIQKELRSSSRSAYGGRDTDRTAAYKKMTDLRNAATQKMLGVFSDEQKTKWNQMIGAPFKGELSSRSFGSSSGYGGGPPGGSRRGG